MSFDWKEYLSLAKELAGQARKPASTEAKLRTAISRAYFSVYHCAKNYLINKNMLKDLRHITHELVRDTFKDSDKEDWRDVGMTIDRLVWARVKADYREFTGIEKKVIEVLSDSETVIDKIDSLE